MRDTKGITLIALIVTTIVLLILAGVSLGIAFNNNGLFEKANSATSRYNQSKEEESNFLQETENYHDKYNGINGENGNDTPKPSETITPTPEPTIVLPAEGAEVPEEGWTIEEAKGLVARDGLKAHLGEKVQYSSKKEGPWLIFYYDDENDGSGNGYFGPTGKLYLIKRESIRDCSMRDHQTHLPSDNGELMKKMNPLFANDESINSIDTNAEHSAAYICDKEEWKDYANESQADFAIGSPSLEMFLKCWNKCSSPKIECAIANSYGYGCRISGQENYTDGINWTGFSHLSQNEQIIFGRLGGQTQWFASPNKNGKDTLWHISYSSNRDAFALDRSATYTNNAPVSLRPVICLK